MNRIKRFAIVLLCLLLAGCSVADLVSPQKQGPGSGNGQQVDSFGVAQESHIETTEAVVHSPWYIPGVDADQLIEYFCEVALDAKYSANSDSALVQKWMGPILYYIQGSPTEEDLAMIRRFVNQVNGIEGFPGMEEVYNSGAANMQIYFCTREEIVMHLGEQHKDSRAAISLWWDENVVNRAIACCDSEADQEVRNGLIYGMLYTCLGFLQNSELRSDSVIALEGWGSTEMTAVDLLILKIMYDPSIVCGMNRADCAFYIRKLYY